jgi:hypothetical protein
MKTIIVFRALVAAALMAVGTALADERPYDINVYRTGTLEQVGQVRHLVTEEQARRFLEEMHLEERVNSLYFLQVEPSKELP